MKRLGSLIWFSIRMIGAALIAWLTVILYGAAALGVVHKLGGDWVWRADRYLDIAFAVIVCGATSLGILWFGRRITRKAA